MTIQASSNWCPTCEELCGDHAHICTTCGSTLEAPPQRATQQQNPSASSASSFGVSPIPDHLRQDTTAASRELRSMLSHLRHEIEDISETQQTIHEQLQAATVAAEGLWDPQAQPSTDRPTSTAVLQQLPRTVLESNSSIFRSSMLKTGGQTLEAIPAEFGAASSSTGNAKGDNTLWTLKDATLIVAEPRTGKGLVHPTAADVSSLSKPVILYMERGGGLTFYEKAQLAQQVGATALVVGNNMAQPWPYVMRGGSGQEALDIPVVMVKQSDGRVLVAKSKDSDTTCSLSVTCQSKDCVVCCDAFERSQTVIRLPTCGHVFHERCALTWLEKHNTCPYCRSELATDNEDYERERRQRQIDSATQTDELYS